MTTQTGRRSSVGHSRRTQSPDIKGQSRSIKDTKDRSRVIIISASHRHCGGGGPGEAPDEGVVHGQPAVVGVPVTFGVQSHRQTWKPSEVGAWWQHTTETVH